MRKLLLIALAATGCFNPKPYDETGAGFYCHPDDTPACPDGQSCLLQTSGDFRCVTASSTDAGTGMALIPKTGMSTPTMDPMLASVAACPDNSLEPNDSPQQAVPAPTPTPDMPTPKITKMAICPTGPRPETGMHDVDFYLVDTTMLTTTSVSMKAEIFYDISYGDLDVGIFDSNLKLLSSDGSAVTNGCTVTTIPAPNMMDVTKNKFYIVVVGANNTDVNRYDIRIRTFSQASSCPSGLPDLGM
jgi:hypothetical protein